MEFAEQLKTAMSGVSQRQLSKRTGIAQSAIGKMLQGKMSPTITMVARLESALPNLRVLHKGETLAA